MSARIVDLLDPATWDPTFTGSGRVRELEVVAPPGPVRNERRTLLCEVRGESGDVRAIKFLQDDAEVARVKDGTHDTKLDCVLLVRFV